MSGSAGDGDEPATAADAALWIDRFQSASSSKDAVDSLKWMLKTSKAGQLESSWLLDSDGLLSHFINLLRTERHDNDFPCEEGVPTILQILAGLAKNSAKQCLNNPSKGALLECLLDVMGAKERTDYDRVLALQLLRQLSLCREAENQWLQAPNGLHRLADVLAESSAEVVRNEALLVASVLAKYAAASKVWIFAEVETQLLDLCWQEGGLTNGNPIVMDALRLVKQILRAADKSLLALVWQRPNLPLRLTQLIDLRGGSDFRFPDAARARAKQKNAKQGGQQKAKLGQNDDDLDNLLQSGSSKPASASSSSKDAAASNQPKPITQQEEVFIPRLIPAEEDVVQIVLEILAQLLDVESIRRSVWTEQPALCSLVWELALCQPSNPPVCALPSPDLQKNTLEAISEFFNDEATMDRHAGLDRLLAIVCTGGVVQGYDDRLGLSQAALNVLRKTMAKERINEYLSHTLAPPPPLEDGSLAVAAGPTVVQKLWNTVAEQLQQVNEPLTEDRALFLSGALGGLSIFLDDIPSREIMLRVTPKAADFGTMLTVLQQHATSKATGPAEHVQLSIVRFFCQWAIDAPLVIQTLLQASESSYLIAMSSSSGVSENVATIVRLLLGLAMEFMGDESLCGGWTRSGLLQIIEKIGIPKFMQSLEKMKTVTDLPWSACEPGFKEWNAWYARSVWKVRKRVVAEITHSVQSADEGQSDDDSDARAEGNSRSADPATSASGATTASSSSKALQRIVAQQAAEIEELRLKLELSESTATSQLSQLETWKRRMESNPTELDTMLTDLTTNNAALEDRVAGLEKELADAKQQHQAEIETREQKTQAVMNDLAESNRQRTEAEQNREQMEQELQALSGAYCTLEEECRKLQNQASAPSTAPAQGMPSPELPGAGAATQPASSATPTAMGTPTDAAAGSSMEVTTLRSDIARLREDAKKADEWMAMAVTRMNDMASHNSTMEQELATCREQLEQAKQSQATAIELVDVTSKLNSAGLIETQLREELSVKDDTLRQLQASMEQAKQLHADELSRIATEVESKEAQLVSMTSALRTDDTQKQGLRTQLDEVQAQLDSARNQLEQLTSINNDLQQQLARTSANAVGANNTAPMVSNAPAEGSNEVVQLQEQLAAARHDLQVKTDALQQQLDQRESRAKELEQAAGSTGIEQHNPSDALEKDSRISELVAANDAAQEWMANAVQHHNELQSSIAALTTDKAALEQRLQDAQSNTTNSTLSAELKAKLEAQKANLAAANERCRTQEAEIKMMKDEATRLENAEQQYQSALQEISGLRQQLAEANQQIQMRSDNAREQYTAAQQENMGLKSSNEELQKRLAGFESWSQQIQVKIAEMLSERSSMQQSIDEGKMKMQEMDASNGGLVDQIKQTTEALAKAVAERDAAADEIIHLSSTIQGLQDELASIKISSSPTEDIIEREVTSEAGVSADANEGVTANVDQHADLHGKLIHEEAKSKSNLTVEELEGTVQQLQEELKQQARQSHEALQELQADHAAALDRCASLEAQVNTSDQPSFNVETKQASAPPNAADSQADCNALAVALATLHAELKEKDGALRSAIATVNGDEDVIQEWEAQIRSLEDVVSDLKTQLLDQGTEAERVIAQWQDSCNNIEERCSKLEKELQEKGQETVTITQQLESLVEVKSQEAAGVQQQLEHLAKEKTTLQEQHEVLQATLQQEQKRHADIVETHSKSLAETQSSLAEALNAKKASETKLEEHESGSTVLKTEIQELQARLSSSEAMVIEKTAAIDVLKMELSMTESTLREAQNMVDEDESVVGRWEARVHDLETSLSEMQAQLSEQEEAANAAIAQWQESYDAADSRCADLEASMARKDEEFATLAASNDKLGEDLRANQKAVAESKALCRKHDNEKEAAMKDLEVAQQRLLDMTSLLKIAQMDSADGDSVLTAWQERCERFELEVQDMEKMLRTQEEEAKAVIEQWEEAVGQADARCTELEAETEGMRQKIALCETKQHETDTKLEAASKRSEKLKKDVQKKEEEMQTLIMDRLSDEAEMEDLKNVVKTKDVTIKDLEAMVEDLQTKQRAAEGNIHKMEGLLVTLKSTDQDVAKYQKELIELKGEHEDIRLQHTEALKARDEKAEEIEQLRKESEEAISQWSDKSEELQKAVSALEQQLQEQEADASAAIQSWEKKAVDLEQDLDALETTKAEVQSLRSQLVSMEEGKRIAIMELESAAAKKLQAERERLSLVIEKLEEELREQNDLVQAFVTDEISDKATEVAAQSLRFEIDQLRLQLRETRDALSKEMARRETSERDADRLKEELSALLSLEGDDDGISEGKLLTVKAAEKLQNKERIELERLRKGLHRSLNDLESSRNSEKEAIEKLAKARLKVSVCEQETIAAKSDLNYLAEAMEELREAEESRRTSLEYRISSLENDREVQGRYNKNEVENLRNEISQLSMEKDRILQSLKESEKTNSALMFASSTASVERDSDPRDAKALVSQLRIENAHLLAVAADDASKAERRLRESMAAHTSSVEADVILERELRVAAESANESLMSQIEKIREELRKSQMGHSRIAAGKDGLATTTNMNAASSDAQGNLGEEVEKLKTKLDEEIDKKIDMKRQLADLTAKSKMEAQSLKEDCRKAQAKAHLLEREARFDSAVHTEVSRLRLLGNPADTDMPTEDWTLVESQSQKNREGEIQLSVANAYDIIREQREAIMEERKMHMELLEEHEDLLALLTQQDTQKESLMSALQSVGGEKAVNAAIQEAESKALNDHGGYVRVASATE